MPTTMHTGQWLQRRGAWTLTLDSAKPVRLEDADPSAVLESSFGPLADVAVWATIDGATDRTGHALFVRGGMHPTSRRFFGWAVIANKLTVGIYRYDGDLQIPRQEVSGFTWDPKLRVEARGPWFHVFMGERLVVRFWEYDKHAVGSVGVAMIGGPAVGGFSGFTVQPL